MSDDQRAVGAMFCVGFEGYRVPADFDALLARGISGAILFARNIESPRQVAELCGELKRRAGRPFLVAIDQEGGRVQRLREPFTRIPSMRAIGRSGDASHAAAVGRILARELRAVNIDMNFAPVLDVDTNPANPVIGDRSFGADAKTVSEMGCALIHAMQAEGLAACGKHFPGHGDTSQDSHIDLPRLPHGMARLKEVELPPFAAAIEAGVASIMTAHVIFEALDARHPATMSRPALDGILRDRMRFDGVVVSDDLEMKAIADHFGLEEAVVRGANAGVDLFLACHHAEVQHRAIDLLTAAVRRGGVRPARIAEGNRRISALVERYVRPPGDGAGCESGWPEHRAQVARTAGGEVSGRDPTER